MEEELRKRMQQYTIEGLDIEKCISIFKDLPRGILDKDFIKKIASIDSLKSRLSELYMANLFSKLDVKNLSGKEDGPDLIFKFENFNINIEVVTPLLVEHTLGKFKVFKHGEDPHTELIEIVDSHSFKARISSVFKSKVEQYKKWSKKNKIKEDDLNIICINIGFMNSVIRGDMDDLWRVFYNEQIICIEESDNDYLYCRIREKPTNVSKIKEDTTINLDQSYYETTEIDTGRISAVLLVNMDNPEFMNELGILFNNPKSEVNINNFFGKYPLLFKIHRHPDHYTLEQIRQNGKLPKV